MLGRFQVNLTEYYNVITVVTKLHVMQVTKIFICFTVAGLSSLLLKEMWKEGLKCAQPGSYEIGMKGPS